jgi:hypothetical protein
MSISDLKYKISSLAGFVGFNYNNSQCGVDPINQNHFEMWCGDNYIVAQSIDEVMTAKIFNGKSLIEIFDKITNLDF